MRKQASIFLLTIMAATLFIYVNLAPAADFTAGKRAEYVLAGKTNPPEQNVVKLHIALGDTEILNGFPYQWVHLKGVKQNGERYAVWALVDNWPGFPKMKKNIRTARYIFQEGNGPAREYVHKISGDALLPEHRKWDILFPVNRGDAGLPFSQRIHYLGHDFELAKTYQGASVHVPGAERMGLLPEVSVGTGRKVRDTEGARIYDDFDVPNKTEYTYQDYSRKDMEELMGAGVNLFWATAEQYEWARDWPVFCVHPKSDDRYPEMLYRSNMLGGHAYYDEPGFRAKNEILRGNAKSREEARQFTINLTKESRRPYFLHDYLDTREDVDLGDLDLSHPIPAWETIISTGWQEMKAGAIGVIQECRYVLHSWIPMINMHYGSEIPPYPDYLIRYNIAILRGAARHFGGDWGVSIYGHTELRIMPQILTLAYDMGAKYFWFWTTAHRHHMPYPEQVNLSRLLKGHRERNPNRDMDALLYAAKAAIAIPEGYTFGVYGKIYMYGKWNMECVNESGVTYRQVMHNAAVEMERLLRMGVDFDIVQDADGFDGEGYEEVIYIRPDATIDIVRNGGVEHRDTPRTPPRPHLQAKPVIKATAIQSGGNVELDASPSGGCPPLGLNILVKQNTEWIEVIWEHYLPLGDRKVLNGSKHTLKLEESGKHRFRAVTADAYGSIADKWFDIRVK